MQMHASRLFSLSDAPQALAADFLRYLVHFVINHTIPTKKPLIAYTDDIADYVAYCMERRKCVVCGREAFLYMLDGEEPGINRQALGLCGAHGAELREKGAADFLKKYHFPNGMPLDKDMARQYGYKTGRWGDRG